MRIVGVRSVKDRQNGKVERKTIATVQLTIGMEALDTFSEALEYAARVTGNDKLTPRLMAMSQECLGEWQRRDFEQRAASERFANAISQLEGEDSLIGGLDNALLARAFQND
jgi:hypothetical protein